MDKKNFAIPRITMRVNILTIFLALVLVSFSTVLIFLWSKNKEVVSELSEEIMTYVHKDTDQVLTEFFSSTEKLDTMIASLYNSPKDIYFDNEQLKSVMLSTVKTYENVAYLYVALDNGNIFTAGDPSFFSQKTYISKPNVPLPEKTTFLWQAIILSGQEPTETTHYLDEQFRVLSTEEYLQYDYDPRDRPWYKGAIEKNGLFWTPVYHIFETESLGITIAEPLRDEEGNIFGVVGVALSFDLLSKFFAEQVIGKNGRVFILNEKGELIIPENKPEFFNDISSKTVNRAYEGYQTKQVHSFEITSDGVRYLCHIEPFFLKNREDWLVAIIVPHKDFFAQLESTQKSAIVIVLVVLGISSLGVIVLATRLSKPIVQLASEVDKVRHLDFTNEERVHSYVKEIYIMDLAISQLRSAMRSFTRYVPKEIVYGLFSQNKEIELGGEKKELTVMFSDIEGFTTITEAQPTEALMELLAKYFDEVSKIILRAEGTIDKYIGDSVMAFWGAPKPCTNQEARCAETALRCRAFIQAFNRECEGKGLPLFKTRFGINTGVAIVGNIGTPERMNYTLIGDMVNAASRMQNKNKDYGTSILIGEGTRNKLGDAFVLRPIDVVEVKGKKERVALFELMGMKGSDPNIAPTKEILDLAERFTKAYEAFHANRKEEAKKLFEALQKEFPDDEPTQRYLERLK